MSFYVKVGARGSPLSKKQLLEVQEELERHHAGVRFDPVWIETTGDKDKCTSLRTLEKSNFFTKEIDEMQLAGHFRVSIHSAKDLPEPLADGLTVIALTKGLDPSDSLVMRRGIEPKRIATCSARREEIVKNMYPHAEVVDLRGTIQERLSRMQSGEVDGVVVAECALIRLGLTELYRVKLDGPVARHQGQLAVIARSDDSEMHDLFGCIDSRYDSVTYA